MKIIKTVFFAFLALGLITCTGIFIFFQTFDTDQYLPQITKKFSLAIGRPVSIGHVGLGLSWSGITLDVGPLTITDDPAFTTQPFIKVDRVRITPDLKSLILRRKIHITNVLIQSPRIHFIRSQEGNFNAKSIGRSIQPAGNNIVKRPNSIDIVKPSSSIKIPPSPPVSVEVVPSIEIQDASISFIDQNQAMPLDIWLLNINASLKDLSLSKPFPVSLGASLYSNVPNVHVSTLVSVDLSKGVVGISDLNLQMDLSHLDSEGLKSISPDMSDSPVFKSITGEVQLNLAHLDIDASGQFTAQGDINITDGVIKHFNIIKTLFSHTMGEFGGMQGSIDNLLKGQSKLGADDTVIQKAHAKFSFHDKNIFIDDSLVQTDIFELTAKGSVDQGSNVDMQTMLHLNNDVSADLVNELEGLKYLMDDSKRIAIGASLKGVIPHLKYKPNKDFKKRSKKMWIEAGGSILKSFLQ